MRGRAIQAALVLAGAGMLIASGFALHGCGPGLETNTALVQQYRTLLYVSESGTNQVEVFDVGPDGRLTADAISPQALSVNTAVALQPFPAGAASAPRYMMAMDPTTNSFEAYTVNQRSGALVPLSQTETNFMGGAVPAVPGAFSFDGAYFYEISGNAFHIMSEYQGVTTGALTALGAGVSTGASGTGLRHGPPARASS